MSDTEDLRPPAVPPSLTARTALFVDFDGTLVELAPTPGVVQVDAGLPALLAGVQRKLDGALALVTGRRLADVDAFLAPLQLPGAGLHGAEMRRTAGTATPIHPSEAAAALADKLRRRFHADPRVLIEDKLIGVGLHYRLAPERASQCQRAMLQLADPVQLEVIVGSQVVEARPRGVDKGVAVRAFMAHAPFTGRTPVFLGDDRTDEDGFAAAAEAGGYGIKVGHGRSRARYRLGAVSAVRDWLAGALAITDAPDRHLVAAEGTVRV